MNMAGFQDNVKLGHPKVVFGQDVALIACRRYVLRIQSVKSITL